MIIYLITTVINTMMRMMIRVRGAGGLVEQKVSWQKSLNTWGRARSVKKIYTEDNFEIIYH